MKLNTYRGTRRATPERPSFLEIRGRLATPHYVGIRRRPEAASVSLTETDTLVLDTVTP